MTLDDDQVERYSRQLILAEVGPRGQERLGAARVAVAGEGVAAERVVAYLAAAGIGWIAAAEMLHAAVDHDQPDLVIVPLSDVGHGQLDAGIAVATTLDDAAHGLATWRAHAGATWWIAAGYAGGSPPCPHCAASALGAPAEVALELAALRAALLGTVVATEVVKALLGIGVPLAGRALTYDPTTATITSISVEPRPDCASCKPHR